MRSSLTFAKVKRAEKKILQNNFWPKENFNHSSLAVDRLFPKKKNKINKHKKSDFVRYHGQICDCDVDMNNLFLSLSKYFIYVNRNDINNDNHNRLASLATMMNVQHKNKQTKTRKMKIKRPCNRRLFIGRRQWKKKPRKQASKQKKETTSFDVKKYLLRSVKRSNIFHRWNECNYYCYICCYCASSDDVNGICLWTISTFPFTTTKWKWKRKICDKRK